MKPSEYIKRGWCQGNLAVDSAGMICDAYAPDAVRWCLAGAVEASLGKPRTGDDGLFNDEAWAEAEERILGLIRKKLKCGGVTVWNDVVGRRQEEVVELLEELGL